MPSYPVESPDAFILESAPDAILTCDATGRVTLLNSQAEALFGYGREELVGRPIDLLLPEALRGRHAQHRAGYLGNPHTRAMGSGRELHARTKDGRLVPVEISLSPLTGADEVHVIAAIRDSSERQAVETALRASEELIRSLIEHAPIGAAIADERGVFELVNATYANFYGYAREEMIGQPITMLVPPEERAALDTAYADFVARGVDVRGEYVVVTRSGDRRTVLSDSVQYLGPDGRPRRATFSVDITERKQSEDRLAYAAHHDTLTALPNRALFTDRLEQALLAARRERMSLAVLLIDLDGFKAVNDSLGHAAGDALLQIIAGRLQAAVRDTDTVARLGGDEFAVLLLHADEAAAVWVASKLRAALDEPVTLGEGTVQVGGSLGIAIYPEHGEDAKTLLRRADHAMYAAKRGGGGYRVYEEDREGPATALGGLGADLRRAIPAGELRLHYQPVARGATRQVIRVEALVRWEHPRLGLLPADQFIPVAERTEAITALTVWVLEEAIRQCAAWQECGLYLGVSVNISPITLVEPQFADLVAALLQRYNLPPAALTLEIAESTLLTHPEQAVAALDVLASTGVRLAVDDLGSGYASLRQLRQLPLHEVKLARSLLADLDQEKDHTLLAFLLGVGVALGVEVVAEGVETETTWEWLGGLNCEMVQGDYVSAPRPAEQFESWLCTGPWRI